jgi:uncharacterized membrane protein YfcA
MANSELIMEPIFYFLAILPVVSFLYSSVGHGGASGYLALMALFSFPNEIMKQTALILNLFVAGISFYQYYKAGHFKFKLFVWFAVGSIPAAYLGGVFNIDPNLYKKILGLLLLVAVARMLYKPSSSEAVKNVSPYQAILIGGLIGFFSGLIGIGGGIILTPVLLLLHWSSMKEAATISALFIWVNSSAALIGQFSSGVAFSTSIIPMIILALAGGLMGSYYGSKKWNNQKLEYLLVVVLAAASFKLLLI